MLQQLLQFAATGEGPSARLLGGGERRALILLAAVRQAARPSAARGEQASAAQLCIMHVALLRLQIGLPGYSAMPSAFNGLTRQARRALWRL